MVGIKNKLTVENYIENRLQVIMTSYKERTSVDYENNLFIHFTYCRNMRTFPTRFNALWNKYFANSPINHVHPVLGTRNTENLQLRFRNNNEKH